MFYTVNRSKRLFKPNVLYDQVDWKRLDAIVDAFADRIDEWYIKPADTLKNASGHFAFAAMALGCILIDTLSQYQAGVLRSKGKTFKDFVRTHLPSFNQKLVTPIQHQDTKPAHAMVDYADVLYHAFRCGILHEAHVTPYGMISGGTQVIQLVPSGLTSYNSSGADCPSVVIDPWLLVDQVRQVYSTYVGQLKNHAPQFDQLRKNFRYKFTESFGVDISAAV